MRARTLLLRRPAVVAGCAAVLAASSTLYYSTVEAEAEVKSAPVSPLQGSYDVAVIGGGIVGLATAREILRRFPNMTVTVLEKEGEVAAHQTGHNSGVIHAGIYYKPGSVMARCCVRGADLMYDYCEKNKLPYERCGKLICATDETEAVVLEKLRATAAANGVKDCRIIDGQEVSKMEPNVRVHSALYSPNTGIADYAAVARHMASEIQSSGRGSVQLRFEVDEIQSLLLRDQDAQPSPWVCVTGKEPGQHGPTLRVHARHVITCAGLQSDKVAQLGGGNAKPKRLGTYYQMKPEFRNICKMNIYPVPSGGGIPVGVHFTPTVNERRGHQMIVGPGACLCFAREAYSFLDMNLRDLWGLVTHVGLWKFASNNFDLTVTEMYRDLNKRAFMEQARKLIPSCTDDMVEESFAGVMAQVFMDDGSAASDFIFERRLLGGTTLHVRNAPSPACTASMAIAEEVVNIAEQDFSWKKK